MEASQQAGGAPEQESHETPRSESPVTPDAPHPEAAPGERPEAEQQEAPEGPAEDQSPVATARDKAIIGDSGLYEQQPQQLAGDPDTPVRTSAPPAELQSGVPLPEDRAAGVEPGPSGPRPAPSPADAATAGQEEEGEKAE